jgi:L-fucose isomerase-like protein
MNINLFIEVQSMSEIEDKINECIEELSRYRYFSREVEEAIKNFEKLKEQIKNLNRENIDYVISGVEEGYRSSLPYSGFIPKTVGNLKLIKEWLESKKAEV